MKNNLFKIKELNIKDVGKDYLNWFRDYEVKKFIFKKKYKNLDELKKYVAQVKKNKKQLLFGVFLKKNNKHIGNIKFDISTKKKNYANLGILIGDKNSRNKGYAFDIIRLSTEYINKKYGIFKFMLGVSKKNLIAINAYKKNGFRKIKKTNKNFLMMLDLKLLNLNKFSLGTAQFGLNYGINNKTGKTKFSEIKRIIEYAENLGITNIDTARAYGDAENILGRVGVKNFKVTSKLPFIEKSRIEDIKKLVKKSLSNLKKRKLECLLIHSTKNLDNNLKQILQEMEKLKKQKLVEKIGISTNNFKKFNEIIKKFDIDVLQVPYNILDKRVTDKKNLLIIKKKNIEIQIRSIFLQGLFFKNYNNINEHLKSIINKNKKLKIFLSYNKKEKLIKLLNFVYKNKLAKNIIIGLEKLSQLEEISAVKKNEKNNFQGIKNNSEILISPNLW